MHSRASSIAPFTACVASGAGTIPSTFANFTPASKHSFCPNAFASITPIYFRWLTIGAIPWYLNPPECVAGGINDEPKVCILTKGVRFPVSPKS